MGANIELWQYKFYENGVFQLEEIHSRSDGESVSQSESDKGKNPSESQKLESRKLKVQSQKSKVESPLGSRQFTVRLRGWFIFPFLFLLVLPIRLMPNLLVDLEQVH